VDHIEEDKIKEEEEEEKKRKEKRWQEIYKR